MQNLKDIALGIADYYSEPSLSRDTFYAVVLTALNDVRNATLEEAAQIIQEKADCIAATEGYTGKFIAQDYYVQASKIRTLKGE